MQWLAVYNDNSYLLQFNEDGEENKYDSIDRSKLASFHLVKKDDEGFKRVASVFFERPSQQLVWRKRNYLHQFSDGTVIPELVYMLGWHENINGKSYKSIMYIHQDETIELAGSRQNIELLGCELPEDINEVCIDAEAE